MSLEELIAKHEGVRLKPYRDSVGKLTIGIGRNLDDDGITLDEARVLLANDIASHTADLVRNFAAFSGLEAARQAVLVDMCFNMGWEALSQFHHTLAAVAAGDWQAAHDGMLGSLWAREVGSRAQEDAQMMLTGEWPDALPSAA